MFRDVPVGEYKVSERDAAPIPAQPASPDVLIGALLVSGSMEPGRITRKQALT